MHYALCHFITEIKKLDGTEYPGKTLYDIVICLQFHLECLGFAFKLINRDQFRDVKYTLGNIIKQQVASGIGLSVRQAQVLSVTDKDYMWSLRLLGTSNPTQLLNMVVFCIGKGFALWAGMEHRMICGLAFKSQLQFMRDSDEVHYLRYTEDIGMKTNKGSLKHKKVTVKTVDLYATDRPECCSLHVIIKYLCLVPKDITCSAFYLQPRHKFFGMVWYLNRPTGINKLHNVVGQMAREAGLPGYYTNHSLHAGTTTKMYQSDIDKHLIQQVTDHHLLAVCGYKRTSQKQRKVVSRSIFSD